MAESCSVIDSVTTDRYALYNGDCCEVVAMLPDDSIGFSVFSPPFRDLFCYSDSERDMGNCRSNEEFFEHFGVLVALRKQKMMPGRVVAVHCMDMPTSKERDGYIGLNDFPSDIRACFQSHGFIFHSRCVIWKDPLVAATRTKALGLMHKQLCKDSAMCRMGIADQILAFRKPGINPLPIDHKSGFRGATYYGSDDPGGFGEKRSHYIWQRYASPVWMDIRQTEVLKGWQRGRDEKDEKHVCPLQTDVIERCVALWSHPDDTVLTPFMGIGSEAYVAIKNGRKAIGVELKPSYFRQSVKNAALAVSKIKQQDMLIGMTVGDDGLGFSDDESDDE